MTKVTQPNFSLNDKISLQVKQAFSLYYYIKVVVELYEENQMYEPISLKFFSQFLEEMHPDIFSQISKEARPLALAIVGQQNPIQLFDYIEKTSNSVFVSPELFFENISVLKKRIRECSFYPIKYHISHLQFIDSKIQNGLIAHYKYKYLFFPLNFGSLGSEKIE